MFYRDWILDSGNLPDTAPAAPPWLMQGPKGRAWLRGLGVSLDDNVDRARQAIKASFPLYSPVDALSVIGEELGMPRGVVETEAIYRARLARAWDLWQWAGTAYGILLACYAAGYPKVILQTQLAKQYSLAASFNFDALNPASDLIISSMTPPVHLGGSPELWSQFAALILKPWPSWWGSSAPADGSSDQAAFASLLKAWKSAHSQCVSLKVIDGPAWGVGITWGAFIWGQGSVTTWTPPAG